MGRPQTILEGLCAHALKFEVASFAIVREGAFQRAWAEIEGVRSRILNFEYDARHARELRENLAAGLKRPVLCVIEGRRVLLRVRCFEDDAYEVTIEQAQPLDPSVRPKFTSKQGQYLAYIAAYTKIHRQAPAESDMQPELCASARAV